MSPAEPTSPTSPATRAPGVPALPEPGPLAAHWGLDPGTVYLNHGSFGACPRAVLDAQRALRDRMEADGVRFFTEHIFELATRNRAALARVVNASPDDLVLGPNATWGVLTVLANIEPTLRPGDELISSRHEYPACRANLARTAERTGARVVEVELPWPVTDPGEIVQRYADAVTERTRLCLLSWVTSPSAVTLPVAAIVRVLRERGVDTLLDAAHGPGYAPLDLTSIGAAYTTANAHKWLCAPKGAALLHVLEGRHGAETPFRPMPLSVHAGALGHWARRYDRSAFHMEFDYTGTDDPTGRLCIEPAIDFLESLDPDGIPGVMARNRALCLDGRRRVAGALGVDLPVPDELVGPMATLPLPTDRGPALPDPENDPTEPDPVKGLLYERYRVQIPVWSVPGPDGRPIRALRLSAQAYNSAAQYQHLADALGEIFGT